MFGQDQATHPERHFGSDQSILGRIFGFGTIVVRGTGGSLEPIRLISDPLTFRSHITAS